MFESFRCRCTIKVGNIGLVFSREVWTRDRDLKVMSILLVTKSREVKYLSQGEYRKQEENSKRSQQEPGQNGVKDAEGAGGVSPWKDC